jgi:hypothetical protein
LYQPVKGEGVFDQNKKRRSVFTWLTDVTRNHLKDRDFLGWSFFLLLVIFFQEAQEGLDKPDPIFMALLAQSSLGRGEQPPVSLPSSSPKKPSPEQVPRAQSLARPSDPASSGDSMKAFLGFTLNLVALCVSLKGLLRSWALMLEAQEQDRAQAQRGATEVPQSVKR